MQQALEEREPTRTDGDGTYLQDQLVLDRFRPLRPLGTGGSGTVWLARDEQTGHEIALKVVPQEGNGGTRAEREVEAAARLRHPRCPRALALERDEDHIYVAYEYVAGVTMRTALRGGQLDDACSIEVAAQVLEALAYAHGKRIVHRDVKPSNVMLEDGDGISVRLLDFGLAQLDEADTLTAANDVPGTLAYIAPERLDGEETTSAADVWAVGVILWEALAGWHPFWAISPVETAKRIGQGAPPISEARPDLPRTLCQAVDRMLDVNPSRRPNAKRLAMDLRDGMHARVRPRPSTSLSVLRERALGAAFAGLYAGVMTALLPFFPSGWPFLLGSTTALIALRSPTAGLAAALALPLLPLGNISLGLALVYAFLAAIWLIGFARDSRTGLLFVSGPLLGPLGALPLGALLAARANGPTRRASQGGAVVLASVGMAAVTGSALPLTDQPTPLGLGIAGSENPTAVAYALLTFLFQHPGLLSAASALALAAAAVPWAVKRGPWGVALWGSALLSCLVLAPPLTRGDTIAWAPVVASVWVASALLLTRLGKSWR